MASLEVLRERISFCRSCHIVEESDYKPTPSSGNPSPVIFVGRNPGIQERDVGKPFWGMTRSTMDKMVEDLGYTRDSLYITNVLKCYTSSPKPNRPPTEDEVRFCAELHLEKELELINPQVVVTFGKDAAWYCSGRVHQPFSRVSGHPIHLPDKTYVLFPLYHPAMLLYNKRKYGPIMERDFLALQVYLKSLDLLGPLAVQSGDR